MPDTDTSTQASRRPRNRPAGSQPSTIGGYTKAIAAALTHYGADAAAVFAAADVSLSLGNDPLNRLPSGSVARLFKACVEATGDPYFGLTVSRFIQFSTLHALGHALAASDTLLDFCKRLARYFRVLSQSAVFTLAEESERVLLRALPLTETCAETEDTFVAFLVLTMRRLYRDDFSPIAVAFHHPPPSRGTQPYEAFFRAPVAFGAASTTIELSRLELTRPLVGACPDLAAIHDGIANDLLVQLDKCDIVAAVKKKIVESLPLGKCTRQKTARDMAMSEATLQSRLAERGTTFQTLVDEAREDLARAYLRQSRYSLTDIAFLLGFSDTSNFARAFRRWVGCSPAEFRRG